MRLWIIRVGQTIWGLLYFSASWQKGLFHTYALQMTLEGSLGGHGPRNLAVSWSTFSQDPHSTQQLYSCLFQKTKTGETKSSKFSSPLWKNWELILSAVKKLRRFAIIYCGPTFLASILDKSLSLVYIVCLIRILVSNFANVMLSVL